MALPLIAPLLLAPLQAIFSAFIAKAVLFFTTYTMIGLGIALSYSFMIACCQIDLPTFTNLFSSLPNPIWWFLELLNFAYGFQLVICALITKWMVSWIPFSPK